VRVLRTIIRERVRRDVPRMSELVRHQRGHAALTRATDGITLRRAS